MRIDEVATERDLKLWEGHRERLRRRAALEGWEGLKPHEMVELALYHAVSRQDVSDLARRLVDHFGSVGGVFGAGREALAGFEGMTPQLVEWVALTGELMHAYHDLTDDIDISLYSWHDVLAFLGSRRGEAEAGATWVLLADFKYDLITYFELREARRWWDPANVRRLLEEAVGCGARYAWLVRWLGDAPLEMSDTDAARLDAISQTMCAAEVPLADCVLVGKRGFYSVNRGIETRD